MQVSGARTSQLGATFAKCRSFQPYVIGPKETSLWGFRSAKNDYEEVGESQFADCTASGAETSENRTAECKKSGVGKRAWLAGGS